MKYFDEQKNDVRDCEIHQRRRHDQSQINTTARQPGQLDQSISQANCTF